MRALSSLWPLRVAPLSDARARATGCRRRAGSHGAGAPRLAVPSGQDPSAAARCAHAQLGSQGRAGCALSSTARVRVDRVASYVSERYSHTAGHAHPLRRSRRVAACSPLLRLRVRRLPARRPKEPSIPTTTRGTSRGPPSSSVSKKSKKNRAQRPATGHAPHAPQSTTEAEIRLKNRHR